MRYTYSLPYYTLCTLRWYHTLFIFFGKSDASGTGASTFSAASFFSAGRACRFADGSRFLRGTQINSRWFFKKSTVKRRCPEPQFVPRGTRSGVRAAARAARPAPAPCSSPASASAPRGPSTSRVADLPSLEVVGAALEPCVNSRPQPPLPPGGGVQWGGGCGVISAICSTNQEFRKGKPYKMHLFQNTLLYLFFFFLSCRISKYFFSGSTA